MKRRRRMLLAAAVLLTAAVLTMLFNLDCGGGPATVTVPQTVTVNRPSSQELKDAYIRAITDITGQANSTNTDFRSQIDKYNQDPSRRDQMVSLSDQNFHTYEDLGASLSQMEVPPEYSAAHRQLTEGFDLWRQAFADYRDGFQRNDSNLLAQARDLDNRAVSQVNQAISAINQVK